MPDILIVEDNAVNRKLISLLLTRAGYTSGTAEHGQEALAALDREPFRLVLMDMMMPVMNGYEATKAIRAHPQHRHIPIIALTANAMHGEEDRCRTAGADDYIAKPYTKDRILSAIAALLATKATSAAS
jgi:CheY-like chemotaxis protein